MLMNAGELQLFEQYMEEKHDLDLYCWSLINNFFLKKKNL